MKAKHYWILTAVLIVLLLSTIGVFAKKNKGAAPPPVVTLETRWTPAEQLVSIPTDTRTVNLQMSATTDRQFWAMDISCVLNQANVFVPTSASQTMAWSQSWRGGNGAEGENHFDSTRDSDAVDVGVQYYDVATNRINASITRVGAANSPVGLNGTIYSEFLFSLELTVAEGLVGTNTIILTCDTISFLDRNGSPLGTATQNSLNNLTLRDGYAVNGTALRQGTTDATDVEVSCEHIDSGNTYVVETESTPIIGRKGRVVGFISGKFGFDKAFGSDVNPLRDFGLYECTFTSKSGGTEDSVYLQGTSFINLQTPNYTFQPITLRTGDTNNDNAIDFSDFPLITANWQQIEPAFTNGDVNGDGIVNEVDLALTSGNVGLSDSPSGVVMDHVIYSVARDFNGTFPNNRMVLGSVFSGDVTPMSNDRAFWPQMSPDGSKIAYAGESSYFVDKRGRVTSSPRNAVATIVQKGIFVSNSEAIAGALIAEGTAFAPSWSPSGDQIAYICSWKDVLNGNEDLVGYNYNNGNLCVVGATGGTPQTIIPPGAMSTFAEVFPPAWYNETTIIYAGNEQHAICPDQLCYYDMLTNTHGKLDINGINGTSEKANMPVVIRYSDGLAYLFYRHFTISGLNIDSEIRMGTITYDSGTNSWVGSGIQTAINNPKLHEVVDNVDGVHYYDVSPMLDVMYYEFGEYQFHNLYFMGGADFSWTEGEDHIVDGFIGYPTITEFNNQVWNGFDELTAGTDFHAYRATFDWIP